MKNLIREPLETIRNQGLDLLQALNACSEGIWALDESGRTTLATEPLAKLLGYSTAELIGREMLEFVHPAHIQDAEKLFGRALQKPDAPLELILKHADGRDVWVAVSATPQRGARGRKAGTLLTVLDIGERVRLRGELDKANHRWNWAADGAKCVLYDWDYVPNTVQWSTSAAAFVGMPESDITPDDDWWREHIHPEDLKPAMAVLKTAIDDGSEEYCDDYRMVRCDGSVMMVRDRARILRDEDGNVTCVVGIVFDITEQRRAEEAAAAGEKRHKQLFDSNVTGVAYWQDEDVTEMNGALRNMLGMTPEDIATPVACEPLTPPDWKWADELAVRELREQGFSAPYEKELLRKDGSRVAARIWINQRPDDPGRGICLVEDLTEAKRVQRTLERTRYTVDNAPELIFWIDSEGTLVDVNDFACRSLGYAREEMLGSNIMAYGASQDSSEWRTWWDDLERSQTIDDRTVLVRRDGASFPAEVRSRLVCYEGERYCCSFARDISDKQAAEKALQDSEERYRRIFEEVSDGIVITDSSARIVAANPKYASIIGYTEEELMGVNVLTLVDDDARKGLTSVRERVLDGAVLQSDWEVVRKDGSRRSVEFSSRGIGDRCVLSVARDVTERKQIEAAQQAAAAEIRELNEMLEQRVMETTADLRDANIELLRRIREQEAAEETVTRRNRELGVLNRVSRGLTQPLSLTARMQTLKSLLSEDLEIPAGAIFTRGKRGEGLVLEDLWGLSKAALRRARSGGLDSDILEKTLREVRPVLTRDITRHPAFGPLCGDRQRAELQSCITAPLSARGQVFGVLLIFSWQSMFLEDRDVDMYETLGQQAGVMLQNAALFHQVEESRDRLQALSRKVVEVQEIERRHIARELHDEVGQVLTAVNYSIERAQLGTGDESAQALQHALKLIRDLMDKARGMSLELRPPMLDDLGLLPALVWHVERYRAQYKAEVSLHHSSEPRRFRPEVETAAYRIVQEALTNCARHAPGAPVDASVWWDEQWLYLRVEDRGRGFDVGATLRDATTSGLTGMHERAFLLGGSLTVESSDDGTSVTAALPHCADPQKP